MAFEFHYSVSLSIVHPTIDPKLITQTITILRPRIEAMAGTERRGKDGKPIIPHRKIARSHWLADLHDEERMYSSIMPISEFILKRLAELEGHCGFFAKIRQEGEVVLIVNWFSVSNHSAGVLSAETLKKCGDLGVDIELNYFGPSIS